MPSNSNYVRLSNVQKQELRDHSTSAPSMAQRELAEWAVTTFKLAHSPLRMTLHRTLKPPKNATALRPAAKPNRSVCCRQLERKLLLWIAKSRTREEIVAAAPQTASKTLMAMAFSNGWLCKFQIRHNLTSKRVHGEAASVNMDAVDGGRAFLQCVTSGYTRRDIFNFDETAYFYSTLPSKTISARPVSGRKNAKKRVTVAVVCNAGGTTKLPLLFVSTSKQSWCLDGKSSAEQGFGYASAPKAWTNTQLFQSWVSQFDESMRDENRRVLLLLGNASLHQIDEPLSNAKLQMLPPNKTALLHPQDAGIIRQFKAQLSKCQTRHVLDCLDDVLDRAMVAGRECAPRELDSALGARSLGNCNPPNDKQLLAVHTHIRR